MAHLCLTLIIKELKNSVEQDRVVTTLNIIFSVESNWLLAVEKNPTMIRCTTKE